MTLPVSAIICTLNSEPYIEACLDTLASAAEVIVVDGFSQDRTVEIARAKGADVYATGPGLASQRQLGLEMVSEDYTLITDVHYRFPSLSLDKLYHELRHFDYDALQAQEWPWLWPKGWSYWTRARASANFGITHADHPVDTDMVGRPALYRTEALRECGFDPFFNGVGDEDTDLSIRMQRHGFKQGIGTGVVWRVDDIDFKTMMRKFVKYGRGDARIIHKYPDKRREILYHLLVRYPFVRGFQSLHYWPYFALCGWVRFVAMIYETARLK